MFSNKLIMITGASSGLGFEFARLYAINNNNLILISKNYSKLIEIQNKFEKEYQIKVNIISCDLTLPENINLIIKYLDENDLIPDILINNAGIGIYGNYLDTDKNRENEIIQLNIITTTALCRSILQKMSEKQSGVILNISSTIAFRQSPYWSVYAASKAYIYSFTRSLCLEFKDSGILISVLCPGKIDTQFDVNSNHIKSNNKDKKRTANYIAQYALDKLSKNKTLIIPGFENKLKYLFFKICPNFISNFIILKSNNFTNNSIN